MEGPTKTILTKNPKESDTISNQTPTPAPLLFTKKEGYISRLFLLYLSKVHNLSKKDSLEAEDLFQLPNYISCKTLSKQFTSFYRQEYNSRRRNPSTTLSLFWSIQRFVSHLPLPCSFLLLEMLPYCIISFLLTLLV